MGRISLGEMIREARHAAGLRLEDVAAAIGVTPGALSHIESGRRLPHPKNAYLISQALDIPPEAITQALDEEHSLRRAQKMAEDPPPVFSPRPIESLFLGEPDPQLARAMYSRSAPSSQRYRSSSSAPREAARWSNDTPERLAALDTLAAEASEAIRTLRGLLEDEDPLVRREARRLLRELDVRLPEE